MPHLPELLEEIVPQLYEDVRTEQNRPLHTNMAQSNQCHVLTQGLMLALHNRGLPASREFHMLEDRRWHFLIRHADPTDPISIHAPVTDLNPWQWVHEPSSLSYIHAERADLIDTIQEAGAPEWFVSLRGTATVVSPHTAAMSLRRILAEADTPVHI